MNCHAAQAERCSVCHSNHGPMVERRTASEQPRCLSCAADACDWWDAHGRAHVPGAGLSWMAPLFFSLGVVAIVVVVCVLVSWCEGGAAAAVPR